jgi:hypothetical protein
MAEITRFVQEFPSLSGPYQTEPVPKQKKKEKVTPPETAEKKSKEMFS